MIIDAWAQHPTLRHSQDPIFDSLRRWTRTEAPTEEIPVAATLPMMDQGNIDKSLISAWQAPGKVLISNDEVALDFPELKIVGGHIGYPWTEEAIAVATKHENVFIDTSAYTTRRYPKELVEFMRGHKVLFGTNYPMIMPEATLRELDELGLDSESREAFLHGNAERVLRL